MSTWHTSKLLASEVYETSGLPAEPENILTVVELFKKNDVSNLSKYTVANPIIFLFRKLLLFEGKSHIDNGAIGHSDKVR